MLNNPICSLHTLYDVLSPGTLVVVERLNDDTIVYDGELRDLITDLENSDSYVVAYNGIYNNALTGHLEINTWDLSFMEVEDE